jgi:hypothetical protein
MEGAFVILAIVFIMLVLWGIVQILMLIWMVVAGIYSSHWGSIRRRRDVNIHKVRSQEDNESGLRQSLNAVLIPDLTNIVTEYLYGELRYVVSAPPPALGDGDDVDVEVGDAVALDDDDDDEEGRLGVHAH